MDCDFSSTLDLCSEPECIGSAVTTRDFTGSDVLHTPKHDMLKVHRILFDRDVSQAQLDAWFRLGDARNTISDLEANKKPMPECIRCRDAVSLPCWCCVDCKGELSQNSFKISPCLSELFG